jgi:hypothetical protein
MDVLIYNELDVSRVKKTYAKVVECLKRDDFYSAEVKKLVGTEYYRAKLDYSNRLLFKIVEYQHKKYALLLEVIINHAYAKSRFLQGAAVDPNKIVMVEPDFQQQRVESIAYINPENRYFHILDKIISLDATQQAIFDLSPPLIVIGSAGSGKTMLTLEKMKACCGEGLYVTNSPYLVQNARQLYYGNHYENEAQEIDFLSYRELLETLQVAEGREIDFPIFVDWLRKNNRLQRIDANTLYEEFKGVITGNTLDKRYLSREAYLNLGIKQSIYPEQERAAVYDLFEKYLILLKDHAYYDINLLSFDYLAQVIPQYDFIVVDEVQDFTSIQLFLLLKTLKHPQDFILCGDSNQIVHPNFFSWAKIKSLFYQQAKHPTEIMQILHKNYRNAASITDLANKILKVKNRRFGSVDRESHYLIENQPSIQGEVYCLLEDTAIRQEINQKTRKSTHFAVIVLRDDLKEKARQHFQTPLIFSIYEAKGLEYENVILYNVISCEEEKFSAIAKGVDSADLAGDLVYGRVKDKADRSLEIYKFFINALYVALTRAIKRVYFIETVSQHALLDLLGLHPTTELIAIELQESSLDEWQKEAKRLEMQGKQGQAEAIRHTILQTQPVPWKIVTTEYVKELEKSALNPDKKDKEARLLLFEYAMHYQQFKYFADLAAVGFTPALKPKKDYDLLARKYFMWYSSNNTSAVIRQVELYGVDFRTIFNQTPLMLACNFGHHLLVRQLIEKGADISLIDNLGRNAWQIALHNALLDKRFAQHKFLPLHNVLPPEPISLQVDNKLIKIDASRMEFFLVQVMILTNTQKQIGYSLPAIFSVSNLIEMLLHIPEGIIAEKRKRRAYLSGLLARHEVNRQNPYNRKLFLRAHRGYYLLNPELLIKIKEQWMGVCTLLDCHAVTTKAEPKLLPA